MNFFAAQERARRRTGVLVGVFIVAVLSLILLAYFAAHMAYHGLPATIGDFVIDKVLFMYTAGGVAAIVLIGSTAKIFGLSGGGGVVAEAMGGIALLPATRDPAEKKLLNIVEEMAIASGTPVPKVYIIPSDAINAFAAGTTLNNAAIGVTKGALAAFSRDEMQGVIAHEFSHIVNGDMRMSIRLVGVIHGLLVLSFLGSYCLRMTYYSSVLSRSRNEGRVVLMMAGITLLLIGAIGAFFGGMIRSAVSRQREFLADAAAVQFTRNPHGIGGALEKIGKRAGILQAQDKDVGEYAHLFFAPGVVINFANMFATHPPLQQRLQRIMPNWNGVDRIGEVNAQSLAASDAQYSLPSQQQLAGETVSASVGAAQMVSCIGAINVESQRLAGLVNRQIAVHWQEMLTDPYTARALIYLMLLDRKNDDCLRQQLDFLSEAADTGVYEFVEKFAPDMRKEDRYVCLVLVQRALPVMRGLSYAQYRLFIKNIEAIIAADRCVEMFEWCVQAIVVHALQDCFEEGKTPIGRASMADINYALSLLARTGKTPPAVFNQLCTKGRYLTDDFEPQRLFASMQRLAKLPPKKKNWFVKTAASLVESDGIIHPDEALLLRAYFLLLDCPLGLASESAD